MDRVLTPIYEGEGPSLANYADRRPGRRPGRTRTVPVQVMLTAEEYEEWTEALARSEQTEMSALVRQAMHELIGRGTRYGYDGVAANGAHVRLRRYGTAQMDISTTGLPTPLQLIAVQQAYDAIRRNGPNDRARAVAALEAAGFVLTAELID